MSGRVDVREQIQPLPAPSFLRTLLTPALDSIDYAYSLGEEGLPYLLLWFCVAFGVATALDRSGKWRQAFLARLVLVFLFSAQLLFLALYLSAFCGESYRLIPSDDAQVIFDPHCHSTVSTGLLTPAQLVEWHRQRGYSAMSVTDSNSTKGAFEARNYARQRYPAFHVVIGEEYKRSRRGMHLVLLGIQKDILPEVFDVGNAIAETHRQRGIAIVAHPWSVKGMSLEEMADLGVDGFEVFNGVMQGNDELFQLCAARNLIMLGATDLKKGPHARMWNVLPVDLQDVPFPERTREIVRALKGQSNRIVTAQDFPGVDGFSNLNWRPETNIWTPLIKASQVVRSMTASRRMAWCGWLIALTAVVVRSAASRRRDGRRIAAARYSFAPRRTLGSLSGWMLILFSGLGILVCGAFATVYELKEVFTLRPQQCFAVWIALDVILLFGFSVVADARKERRTMAR